MASGRAASRRAPPFIDPPRYAQHRPEETLLYRLVEAHYPAFRAAPTAKELEALVERIAERIGEALERAELLAHDCDNGFLTLDTEAGGPMDDLLGHSITYRVAMGPRAGQKVFTLQTVPAQSEEEPRKGVAEYAGFSLHAATSVEAEQTGKLERLCRYVSRPAIAEERSELTERGEMRCA